MRVDWETEICVIGGGPAGSTIAQQLALFGHQVLLVEQHEFPRPHVGESITPSILPLLDTLGVRERIQSERFLRPDRALIRWRNQTGYMRWLPNEPGFQVDRGRFDLLLLQIASEAGVKIVQPAQALRPIQESNPGWLVPLQHAGRIHCVKARFLVDASGRQSRIASKRVQTSPPTFAVYGYWRDTSFREPETRVEAGDQNWFWGAPLPSGMFNAAIFLDPKRIKLVRPTGLESFYRGLLSESTLLSPCLDGKLTGGVRVCNASSYHDQEPVNESFIKVGEACFAVDPLSSQGVQFAMLSGLQGSIVCHTILSASENAGAAIRFYRDRQAEFVRQHLEWAARYYAEQHSTSPYEFWEKRSNSISASRAVKQFTVSVPFKGCRVEVSKDVGIVETSVLDGKTIRLSPAIDHPGLTQPVAFLKNIPIVALLGTIVSGQTLGDTLEKWSNRVSADTAEQILCWMWYRKLIVPVSVD